LATRQGPNNLLCPTQLLVLGLTAVISYDDNLTILGELGFFPPSPPELKLTLAMCAALKIEGTPGKTVDVEYRSSIQAADPWKPLTSFSLPTTPYLFVDTNSIGNEKRFYRALER
jgi:hypothetical protein